MYVSTHTSSDLHFSVDLGLYHKHSKVALYDPICIQKASLEHMGSWINIPDQKISAGRTQATGENITAPGSSRLWVGIMFSFQYCSLFKILDLSPREVGMGIFCASVRRSGNKSSGIEYSQVPA